MVVVSLMLAAMYAAGLGIPDVFIGLGMLNLLAVALAWRWRRLGG